jgi:hypothetical protein
MTKKSKLPEDLIDPLQVKVLENGEKTVLVEWFVDSEPFRGYVPAEAVVTLEGNCYVSKDDLDMAVIYGIDWQGFELTRMSDDKFKKELIKSLHTRGLWTPFDISTRPTEVQAVINDINGAALTALLQYALAK